MMRDSMGQKKQQFVRRVGGKRQREDRPKGYEEREDWNVAESARECATPNGLCGQ